MLTTRLAATVIAVLLALTACGPDDPAQVDGPAGQPDAAVYPLMKAEGWRADLDPLSAFAILEIAHDADTAMQAWQDNTSDGLEQRDGPPDQPGIYGDIDAVDFDTHVLVVYSSGESGSCPEWIDDIDTTTEGLVEIRRARPGTPCTDDYNPYRMVLAVAR